MLYPALMFKDELNKKYMMTWSDPRYKYYSYNYHEEINIDSSDYSIKQYVSVDPATNEVIGYISYSWDMPIRRAYGLGLINFKLDDPVASQIFIADFITQLHRMFCEESTNVLLWNCIDGNPLKRSYDKLAPKLGARHVGIFHDAALTADGEIHDIYHYELQYVHLNLEYLNKLYNRVIRSSRKDHTDRTNS